MSGFAEQQAWLTLRPHTVLILDGHFATLAEYLVDGVEYDAYSQVAIEITNEQLGMVTSLVHMNDTAPGFGMYQGAR